MSTSNVLTFEKPSKLYCKKNLPKHSQMSLSTFGYKEFGRPNTYNDSHSIVVFADARIIARMDDYDAEMPEGYHAEQFKRDRENQRLGFYFWFNVGIAGEAYEKISRSLERTLRLSPFSKGEIETNTVYLPNHPAKILLNHQDWKDMVNIGGSKSPLVTFEDIPDSNGSYKRFFINEELYENLVKAGLCQPQPFRNKY